MGKKGISIIKGIETQEIISLLNRAYADEWLAYYQYFIGAKADESKGSSTNPILAGVACLATGVAVLYIDNDGYYYSCLCC